LKKILTFDSIHFLIKAEGQLRQRSIPFQVITTPQFITVDCGMSIEIDQDQEEEIFTLLQELDIKYKVYERPQNV
jgi:hypothetical protein